jgi:prepilin peptidase CpaA
MSSWLIPAIAVLVGCAAAITDLRSGRMPNILTLPAMVVGLILQGACRGAAGLLESAVGMLICGAVPGIVYKASQGRGIGGGDIKLFAALGALLGPMHGLEVELSSFVLIGVFAIFRLAYSGHLGQMLLGSIRVMAGLLVPRLRHMQSNDSAVMTEMRMGPAIAMAIVTVLSMPHLTRWLPWLG